MSNLVNDMSASITGYENVGGIIGENHGVLTDPQNLMNKGTISGVTDVGGIIGENYGIVANINNQIPLISLSTKHTKVLMMDINTLAVSLVIM